MAWSHPDISLEDLLQLIKGFVDIVILASGYQSSGAAASWDSENIKKAVRWGAFFEEVFKRLQDSNSCSESIKELDDAILQIISDPHFPKGLAHLSSASLANGREFVLNHLFQNIHMTETHITAILVAIVEMDLESFAESSPYSTDIYLENLITETETFNLASQELNFMENPTSQCQRDHHVSDEGSCRFVSPNTEPAIAKHDRISTYIIKEILKRQSAVSCLLSAKGSLDSLREIVVNSNVDLNSYIEMPSGALTPPKKEETPNILFLWNHWRSRSLSYLLDSRTIRLLSGTELVFSASRDQWIRILNPLRNAAGIQIDNLLETIELVLLALISRRWKNLIEYFTSYSSDHLLPEQNCTMHDLLLRINLTPPFVSPKENDLLVYLMDLLGSETRLLWRSPPVLVAAAVSLSSFLFKLYVGDLGRQVTGGSSSTRYYNSKDDGNDHIACETSERIWCLYMISCHNSHAMVSS